MTSAQQRLLGNLKALKTKRKLIMASISMNSAVPAVLSLVLATFCSARCVWPDRRSPAQLYKDVDGEATNESEAKAARLNPLAYSALVLVPPLGAAISLLHFGSGAAQLQPLQWDIVRWTGPVLWVSSRFPYHSLHFANTRLQVIADVPIHLHMPAKENCAKI